MDKRLITLLVIIAIIVAIGFMTKWTFRFRRSTYDGENKISEEELAKIEKELEAELEKEQPKEGYEMYDSDSDDDSDAEDFVE